MAKTIESVKLFIPTGDGSILASYLAKDGGKASKDAVIQVTLTPGELSGSLAAAWASVVGQISTAEGI